MSVEAQQSDRDAVTLQVASTVTAARAFAAITAPVDVKCIKRAVANLVRSIQALAAWEPVYGADGRAVDDAVAKLVALRKDVRVKLIEVDELIRDYPEPIERLCSVASRVASIVVDDDTQASRAAAWFAKFVTEPAAA